MVEYLGFLYRIIKDIKEFFTYKEDEKKIDDKYVEQLKKQHQDKGEDIDFRWSKEDKIEARKADGWDYYYQSDNSKKKKFILKNTNGQILIARNKSNNN